MLDAIGKKVIQRTPESLSTKVVRGGLWVFALRIINHGFRFVRIIILARLLVPEDFGLLGIAMLSISALEIFSQTGFQTALIQKKDNIESYLDTAWTVSAIRGTVLFMILFLSAPTIAYFFNSSEAVLVIRIIAISTLLSGFTNIGIVFFRKEMEFNKQFFYEFSSTVVDLTVAITLAFILRNVWALVWGGLAANLTRLCMSYVLHAYRPRVTFRKEKFKELFGFGKWVLGSSILVFLVTQGDDIFVGKLLGVTALGLYQVAYTLGNLPATEITHVIGQVTFPAYSKLQDDPVKLREAYLRILQLTAFLSFPLAAAIIVLAPQFIDIFLGRKWLPAAPLIQVLALAGVTRSIAATAGSLFYALGKTKIDTKLQVIRLAVLAVTIYPLTIKFKLLGVPIAVFASILISNVGFNLMALKLTKCSKIRFLKIISIPLINGVFTALIILLLKTIMGRGLFELIVLLTSGAVIYLGVAYLSDKFLDYRMGSITLELLTSIKSS
jgi:O-antigen/teichoic acid export membrane protein